jgi:hypothetical protein
VVGDLVKEIMHDDGSGSAAWGSIVGANYMLNNWALSVAPGVYVFRVESLVPGQEGRYHIGKFAIIR